jgi:hypothetical protein
MTDDPVTRIDEVLHDWTVSADAMRSRPAPESEPPPGQAVTATSGRIWISTVGTEGDDGWQPLGVTSIETAVDLERFTAGIRAVQEAVAANVERTLAAAQAALRGLAEALHGGGEWVDTNGNPVEPPVRPRPPLPRRDRRPAWQTPYGPARGRR